MLLCRLLGHSCVETAAAWYPGNKACCGARTPQRILACSEPAWPAGAAYTDLQSACSASSGTLQYVKKGQTCADLAAAGGLTLAALKQLNPHLNCKQPQAGWAVCLQSAHAAINNAAPEGVRRVVQQPMQG